MVAFGAEVLSFGVGAMGRFRSKRYEKLDGRLAQLVQQCWLVPVEATVHVSEPIANIADRYLSDKVKEAAVKAFDPAEIVIGMYIILEQCQEREQRLVAEFLAAARSPQPVNVPVEGEAAPYVDPAQAAGEALDVNEVLQPEAVAA